jgi:hypothetical protein
MDRGIGRGRRRPNQGEVASCHDLAARTQPRIADGCFCLVSAKQLIHFIDAPTAVSPNLLSQLGIHAKFGSVNIEINGI